MEAAAVVLGVVAWFGTIAGGIVWQRQRQAAGPTIRPAVLEATSAFPALTDAELPPSP